MDYIEVTFEIKPFSEDNADIVVATVEELGFESFVTENGFLKAYIPRDKFSRQNLKTVMSAFGGEMEVSWTADLIAEQNWNREWESNFDPIVVEGRCTVKAPFHKGLPRTRFNITLDPRMAFGTGHHQTTYMLLDALISHPEYIRGRDVLDMGCGTGVLAIMAAKLKASIPVHAIDIDQTAVWSAVDNARRNRVGKMVAVRYGDASLIQAGRYDCILANINRNILLQDMTTYSRGLRPGGVLLLSGFYTADIPMLLEEAQKAGMTYISDRSRDGWAVLVLGKSFDA